MYTRGSLAARAAIALRSGKNWSDRSPILFCYINDLDDILADHNNSVLRALHSSKFISLECDPKRTQ